MIEIRRIQFSEAAEHPDFIDILNEYADEAGITGLPRPNCQVEMYKAMQNAGVIHVIGAFSGDSLVGVVVIIVSVVPHYGKVLATTESFFVRPSDRKSGAGLMLLKEAEILSEELGAIGLLISAPAEGRLAEILPRKGYAETNRVFFRNFA
jgi:hypothetical protein